ncbi:DNA-binding CsgD family transcriptional regulator/RecA/RadA recombinase [Mycolicibacterium sp. BK556]|uniref:AAA family ATPase n=1 Tax=unclassified Mycolicibacterium TaxID=2636767 RepID=UPI00161AC948|nr:MULTISPECIES: LuxR family transcriptional regulator [unclassified Mycolicibacterium]MBB3603306.1 DNA-binding CsgD family transcriptional regulator/RecA/RadA recombinase [Mycolicibacterium sp. BK556]MBB3633501.1 DNA-binding CsgD family transcriptional regulator/RecA/RadA recombinase [Mycolicibacterium sp. BK607]
MVDVLRGRDCELIAVAAVLQQVEETGRGAVIHLCGEPGIGKTALVQAIAAQAADAGFAVGSGKAEELHQIAAGAPLLVALRSGPSPLLDADTFMGLAPLHHQPLWLIDRIASVLEGLSARTPVLIVIDDAQWADQVTQFALDTLPGRLAGSPVVWLIASRAVSPGSTDRVDRHLLVLRPLSDADLDEIAHDYLGGPAEGLTRQRLYAVGGNPFLAVQLLAGVAAGDGADDIPASFAAAIDARLHGLGAGTGELIELAAVWGRPLDLSDAAELLGESSVAVIGAWRREAHQRGLLADDRDHIVFAHDLIREASYQNVPAARRRELHLRCAKYLVASGKGAVAAAPHASAGARYGDPEVVEILRAAAAQTSLTMPAVAAGLIVEAFELLDPHDSRRFEIGEQCAEILIRAQRGNDAVSVIDALLAATSDTNARTHLQSLAAQALWLTGRLAEIDRRVVEARARPGLSPRCVARLAAVEALVLTRTGTARDAIEAGEAALARGRALGDERTQLLALQALAEAGTAEGRHASARGHYQALRALGGTTYLAGEVLALQQLDRFAEAEELLVRAHQGSPGEHNLPSLAFAQLLQDFKLGRLAEAEAGALAVIRLCEQTGTYVHNFEAWLIAGIAAVIRGDLALARERLRAAEETGLADDAVRQPPMLLIKGRIAGAEGRYDDSVRILKPLMDSLSQSRSWWPRNPELLRVQAGIAVAADDYEFAHQTVQRAKLAADRNPGVASFEGVALHVEGFVARDPDTLRSAVKILRESPRPLLLAGALADYGSVLLDAGDRHSGVAALSEAFDVFSGLGANHYLRGVERDLSRAAESADEREPLTKSEERVAQLVSEGHTNQSVASALGVSVHTVNTHLRAVFRKMGVRSRVQLANAMSARAPRR